MDAIPDDWELLKMKYLFSERVQKGYPDEPLLAATQTMGVVPKSLYENRTVVAMKDLHLLKLVKQGDYVISLRSFEGGIEYAHYRGIISPAYTVLCPGDIAKRDYFEFFFKSKPFVDALTLYVTGIREGQNIDYNKLCNTELPVPPIETQEKIGGFLRFAIAKINHLIRAKRRVIELLNEQKQAIIHRAVTRGLDPNVPLKPSGIDWLGDIPEHWSVKRLKWVTRLQRGYDLPSDRRLQGTIPVVSSGGIIDTHSEARAIAPGVVMGRYGSTDSVFYLEEEFWPHNTALFVTNFQGNDPRWCYYLLRVISKVDLGSKSAVPGVDRKDLYEIPVAIPPLREQPSIAAQVADQLNHFEKVTQSVQFQIDRLREYRTRLIADVVTGKLDVRGVELPELEPEDALEPLSDSEEGELEEAEELLAAGEDSDAD